MQGSPTAGDDVRRCGSSRLVVGFPRFEPLRAAAGPFGVEVHRPPHRRCDRHDQCPWSLGLPDERAVSVAGGPRTRGHARPARPRGVVVTSSSDKAIQHVQLVGGERKGTSRPNRQPRRRLGRRSPADPSRPAGRATASVLGLRHNLQPRGPSRHDGSSGGGLPWTPSPLASPTPSRPRRAANPSNSTVSLIDPNDSSCWVGLAAACWTWAPCTGGRVHQIFDPRGRNV